MNLWILGPFPALTLSERLTSIKDMVGVRRGATFCRKSGGDSRWVSNGPDRDRDAMHAVLVLAAKRITYESDTLVVLGESA